MLTFQKITLILRNLNLSERLWRKIRRSMVSILQGTAGTLTLKDSSNLKKKTWLLCIRLFTKILTAMILCSLEIILAIKPENSKMFAGFVKDGMSKCLNLLCLSQAKMGRTLFLFTLISNNMNPVWLIWQKFMWNTKQWFLPRSIAISSPGIRNNFFKIHQWYQKTK